MREITDLKEIQQMAFHIFAEFETFCREYNIQYFMAFGTLIGTVRHQGFIPWDDDIDVWVKREEYDKLSADGADKLPGASFKNKIYGKLAIPFRRINQNKWTRKYEKVAKRSDCASSDYLLVPYRQSKGRTLMMPAKWVEKSIRMKYENMEASVPVGYDNVLRFIYGDYMQLPPEKDRKPIHCMKLYVED